MLVELVQLVDLLLGIVWHTAAMLLALPLHLLGAVWGAKEDPSAAPGVSFYEGIVFHIRRAPVVNTFRCAVNACMRAAAATDMHGLLSPPSSFSFTIPSSPLLTSPHS